MKKLPIFLFLSLFFVGCTTVTAVSQSQPQATPTSPPLPPTTDAIWVDAAYIAEDLDISVEEAVRRTTNQDNIGYLNAALTENETETFGGLWLEHEPTYQVVIAFTENGDETLRPYLATYPIAAPISVIEVESTYAELQALQTAVSNQLSTLQYPHASSVSVQDNLVEVLISDQALFEETLQNAGVTLPENVRVISTYDPLTEPLPVTAVPDVHMPQLKVRSTTFMEALTIGNLEIVDGCLRIVGDNDSQLVIWQTDYFLNDNDGTLEVWDETGNAVATVGEPIAMGGGEGRPPQDHILKEPLPEACVGPFWYMGEILPNVNE